MGERIAFMHEMGAVDRCRAYFRALFCIKVLRGRAYLQRFIDCAQSRPSVALFLLQ